MKSKSWGVLGMSLVAALVVAGCGGGGGSSSSDEAASISDASPEPFGGETVLKELQDLYQAAQDGDASKVVVYGATANNRDDLYARFEARFPGIKVVSEQLTGPNLTSKLNQEYASDQHLADIVHTGSTTMADIADKGRFAKFDPVSDSELPDRYIAPSGLFRSDAASFYGILYNSKKIDKKDAPKSWNDLLDPSWKGKMVLDDPTHMGATAGFLGRFLYDPKYDKDWLTQAAKNIKLVSTGQSSTKVITGAYEITPFHPYIFYLQDKQDGAPLGFVFPVEGGNRLAPHFLGLLNKAPHPNAAKLLITWLFTPEAQKLISKTGDYPTMPGAPAPGEFPELSELTLLKPIPLDKVTEVYAEKLKVIQQAFGRS